MDEQSTADSILLWFKEQSAQKVPLDPLRWLEASTKLESLAGDEEDKLIELEFKVATLRAILLEQHGAAAKAKVHVEASPIFKEMKKQKSKCEQIKQMVQLGKHWARIKNEQMRSGL